MNRSENIGELVKALRTAQAEMENPKKGANNPFFKSKYADLTAIVEAVRKPLTDHGIAFMQWVSASEGQIHVETMLAHDSGQWISETLSIVPKDKGPQAAGSAITYAKRYGLQSACGIAPEDEDDDAEAAHGRPSKTYHPDEVDPESEAKRWKNPKGAKLPPVKANGKTAKNVALMFWTHLIKSHDGDMEMAGAALEEHSLEAARDLGEEKFAAEPEALARDAKWLRGTIKFYNAKRGEKPEFAV